MKHVLCLVLLAVGIACCALLARRAGSADTLAPTPYDAAIRRAARRHLPEGWDWRIFKAMVYQESRFDPHAFSLSGAVGLCQLMPATADRLGLRRADLQRPEASLDAGARYLRECWDTLEGLEDAPPRWDRSRAAVAAYHAGPGAVRRARAACGPAGRSWHAISGQLPEAVRRHVDAVFGEAYRGTRRVHPGGAPGVCTPAVEFPGPGRGRGPQR
jgi:soluble lytic murein transglycosylase-like protein